MRTLRDETIVLQHITLTQDLRQKLVERVRKDKKSISQFIRDLLVKEFEQKKSRAEGQ